MPRRRPRIRRRSARGSGRGPRCLLGAEARAITVMSNKVTSIKSRRGKPARVKAVDLDRIASGVRLILEGIGEDPNREGLRDTPKRVAEMYAELTAGERVSPFIHIRRAARHLHV